MPPDQTGRIEWMAHLLKARLENNRPSVLFIGSRAGGFRRENSKLLEILRQLSSIDLDSLPKFEQFGVCYKQLTAVAFSPSDVHNILLSALEEVEDPSPGDDSLAELVKEGYFDTVISANIDNLLEKALDSTGMREGRDFSVQWPSMSEDLSCSLQGSRGHRQCKILKIFGDLLSTNYHFSRPKDWRTRHEKWWEFLETEMQRDLLMVGFDPVWDAPILGAIPIRGDAFWYVNGETDTNLDRSIQDALDLRNGATLCGKAGSYESFFKQLYWGLYQGPLPSMLDSHRGKHQPNKPEVPAPESLSNLPATEHSLVLSPSLHERMRAALIASEVFKEHRSLRALFSDPLLEPWRRSLPDTTDCSLVTRVDLVIDFLYKKRNIEGEPALVLLLQILLARIHSGDALHRLISQLSDDLRENL